MMSITEVKAWAFDKQIQLEAMQVQLEQFNNALQAIGELVGLPPGEPHKLQTLIDAVGAVAAKSKTEG